jgi:hypothetical protein
MPPRTVTDSRLLRHLNSLAFFIRLRNDDPSPLLLPVGASVDIGSFLSFDAEGGIVYTISFSSHYPSLSSSWLA